MSEQNEQKLLEKPLVQVGELVPMAAIERAHFEAVLARTTTLAEAAGVLGVDYATLYRKRRTWGMPARQRGVRGAPVAPPVAPVAAPAESYHQLPGLMEWKLTPPVGVPLETHNLNFFIVLRLGLRLIEPKGSMCDLFVGEQAFGIVTGLSTYMQRSPLSRTGWLGVQSVVQQFKNFTGWNVYFVSNLTVPFQMRDGDLRINGSFE